MNLYNVPVSVLVQLVNSTDNAVASEASRLLHEKRKQYRNAAIKAFCRMMETYDSGYKNKDAIEDERNKMLQCLSGIGEHGYTDWAQNKAIEEYDSRERI